MIENGILGQLHAVRKRLFDDAGGTFDGLVDRLQIEEQKSDRPRFKPRQAIQSTPATKSGESATANPSPPPGDQ